MELKEVSRVVGSGVHRGGGTERKMKENAWEEGWC